MSLFPGFQWLAWLSGQARTPSTPRRDPADMGTAFGLDASMATRPADVGEPVSPAIAPASASRRFPSGPR